MLSSIVLNTTVHAGSFRAAWYVYGKVFVPPDAEGTEQGTGETRLATLKKLWPNVDIIVVPKVPVDDGIAKGRLMFARLWVDEANCAAWLDYVAQYRQEWDESRRMFTERPYHDFTSHAADEYRYASVIEAQMTNEDDITFEDGGKEEHEDVY